MHDFNKALEFIKSEKHKYQISAQLLKKETCEIIEHVVYDKGEIKDIEFALRAMIKLQGEVSDDVTDKGYVEFVGMTCDIDKADLKDAFKAMLSETLKEVEQENGK